MKWVIQVDGNIRIELEGEVEILARKAFAIIELVEVTNISEPSFMLIRRKLLNLGNDIRRLCDVDEVGDCNS